jgi:peroxiredoxin
MKYLFFLFLVVLGAKTNAQPKQGAKAFEIALPSLKGDTVKLSALKGKVVLLDFWASWCKPCRASNKELVKIYAKLKNKGFEIFAVSLDEEKAAWKKAVATDKITWIQVNDMGGFDAKIAQQWDLFAIPTSFLIDKDGTLIAMDLTGKQLEKALKSLIDK